jgi:hypothetical protein
MANFCFFMGVEPYLKSYLDESYPKPRSGYFFILGGGCFVELYSICLLAVWPVSVSYRHLPVGIFGLVFFVL